MNIRTVLRVINTIAKYVPFLAAVVEKITAAILARVETSDEIIKSRLQTDANLEPKTLGNSGNNILLNKDRTSAEEKTEVVPSVQNDDVGSVPQGADRKEIRQVNATGSVSAQEITLKHIEQDFQDNRERKAKMLRNINFQESIVFNFMLGLSFVTIVFIIWGGYIIFHKGLNILAILAEFVGLASGAGSLLLRRIQEELKEKAALIERQQDEQTRYLRAIQTALSLTGPERERELAETAKWLRDQVGIKG